MLDKFNFYDIYGYFLPGALLLLLIWAPIGLVRNVWPAGDWSSAVIAVVLAYISGFVLQMFAGKVIPSSVEKGADNQDRYPSERFMDSGAHATNDQVKKPAEKTKERLAALVETKFGLTIADAQTPDELKKRPLKGEVTDIARRDAFFQARHYLILAKDAGYAEQFEAMYTLARGMAAAMALAAAYYIGWALSAFESSWSTFAAVIVITLGLLLTINASALLLRYKRSRALELLCALGLLLGALGIGYGLGRRYQATAPQAAMLGLCAGAALLGCLRSYRAYRGFIEEFATTVWRDFLVTSEHESTAASTAKTT